MTTPLAIIRDDMRATLRDVDRSLVRLERLIRHGHIRELAGPLDIPGAGMDAAMVLAESVGLGWSDREMLYWTRDQPDLRAALTALRWLRRVHAARARRNPHWLADRMDDMRADVRGEYGEAADA